MEVFHVEDRDIVVKVGEPFSIELESLGTAGYEWIVRVESDNLEQVRHDTGPSLGIGGGGLEMLTFQPSKPGDAKINLELKRRWEATAARTHVIHAHIE